MMWSRGSLFRLSSSRLQGLSVLEPRVCSSMCKRPIEEIGEATWSIEFVGLIYTIDFSDATTRI